MNIKYELLLYISSLIIDKNDKLLLMSRYMTVFHILFNSNMINKKLTTRIIKKVVTFSACKYPVYFR